MLSDSEIKLLNAVLNELIPARADGRVPGAGDLGVAAFLGRAAAADDGLAVHLRTASTTVAELVKAAGGPFEALAPENRRDLVAELESSAPEAFQALLRQTYMGYYSRPDVRVLFGLSDQPTQPNGYDMPSESPEFMAELTAPVVARGRCYRSV